MVTASEGNGSTTIHFPNPSGAREPQAGDSADAKGRPQGAHAESLQVHDDDDHDQPVAANVLDRQFTATGEISGGSMNDWYLTF
jgi:hypothetical protein